METTEQRVSSWTVARITLVVVAVLVTLLAVAALFLYPSSSEACVEGVVGGEAREVDCPK